MTIARCHCWAIILSAFVAIPPEQVIGAESEPTSEGLTAHASAAPASLANWFMGSVGENSPQLAELDAIYGEAQHDFDSVSRSAQLLTVAEPRLAEILDDSVEGSLVGSPIPPKWFVDSELPPAARANVALAVAGELHARRFYEELLAWLDDVNSSDVIAPYLLYYYRAVAQHQLVQIEAAIQSAKALLALEDLPSRREQEIARLILRDAELAEPDSPGHLARQMNDIRRRLDLGRASSPEQELQQEVIDSLDKLIEAAEQQQQQQQQQAAASSGATPSSPQQDSRPSDWKGPGEVDRRDIPPGGDWGSLPPEERQRVTQEIGRDFPAYYRDVIEAYFRSLAQQSGTDSRDSDSDDNGESGGVR